MRRLLRYVLRALLVVLLLLDVYLFVWLVFPTDRFFEWSVANVLQIVLIVCLLLGAQVFILWLDIRIGGKTRSVTS